MDSYVLAGDGANGDGGSGSGTMMETMQHWFGVFLRRVAFPAMKVTARIAFRAGVEMTSECGLILCTYQLVNFLHIYSYIYI